MAEQPIVDRVRIVPGVYRHSKSGVEYLVLFVGHNCTNSHPHERLVVYFCADKRPLIMWVRTLTEFAEWVDVDGACTCKQITKPRFLYLQPLPLWARAALRLLGL